MDSDVVYLVTFDCEDSGTVGVEPRCPECQRYIKHGQLFLNGLDEVKLQGWTCKLHGEVKPHYEWVDPEDMIKA